MMHISVSLLLLVGEALAFQPYDTPRALITAPENEIISEFLIVDLNQDDVLDVVFAGLIEDATSEDVTNLYVALGENSSTSDSLFATPMHIGSSQSEHVRFDVVNWDNKGFTDVCVAEGVHGFRCIFIYYYDGMYDVRTHSVETNYMASHIAVLDTNSDGRDDIAVLDNVDGVIHIYYNIGDGSFDYSKTRFEEWGILFHTMHKFDFDLDGEPGLILTLADGHLSDDDPFPALHEGRPLSIQNQDGNIGFWMWAESRHSAANATDTPMMPEAKRIRGDVAAGHVNSDTYNDFVALAHDETHAVHVFVGTGAVGKFAGLTSTLTPPCSEEQELTYVELYNFAATPSSNPDLIVGWSSTENCPSTIAVHANNDNATFAADGVAVFDGVEEGWVARAQIVDVDVDGYADLVVTGFDPRRISLFRNTVHTLL